jgi:ATP-dependent Clp protease ATP-binding subunit ClpA
MKNLKRKIIYSEDKDTEDTENMTKRNKKIKLTENKLTQNKLTQNKLNEIKTLDDLIELGNTYSEINMEYNGINLKILYNIIEPLKELNKLIGLEDIKNNVIDNCLYIARGYNSNKCNSCIDCENNVACVMNSKEMLHTVILGPPGVGKTEFAKILTKIYSKIGLIKNNKILHISRKDLISGYLGRTAKKTEKIFKKAKNGVLFIDEVYSLGNVGNDDTYSKECIDTINKNLSENRDTIVIIAGYEKEIEECFFRVNPGLKRRFPFTYKINGYTSDELYEILKYKISNDNWTIDKNDDILVKKYINNNMDKFPNFGGDIETLILKAKIKNSRNINSQNFVFKYNDFIN